MWRRFFGYPVTGNWALDPFASVSPAVSGAAAATGDFERMVVLLRSNEQLFGALEGASQRLHEVRTYMAQDDCNVSLGRECYRYWRDRHSGVLTQLRANRLEARRVLRRLDATVLDRTAITGGSQVPS